MQTFKAAGREWNIKLNFGEVERIKQASEGKFDLLEYKELPQFLQKDLREFWVLLWFAVEPQAKAANITAEQFGECAEEFLVDARQKFYVEWSAFFRRLQIEDAAIALEKMAAYMKEAVAMVRAKLSPKIMEEVDSKVTAKMQRTLNEEFGKLLAKLEE